MIAYRFKPPGKKKIKKSWGSAALTSSVTFDKLKNLKPLEPAVQIDLNKCQFVSFKSRTFICKLLYLPSDQNLHHHHLSSSLFCSLHSHKQG